MELVNQGSDVRSFLGNLLSEELVIYFRVEKGYLTNNPFQDLQLR